MMPAFFYRIKELFFRVGAKWDEMAPDKNAAIEFAHKHINEEPKRERDAHHFSLEYCLAHYGEMVNEHYRMGRPDETDLKIAAMVNEHTTDTALVLYRGICGYIYDLMKKNGKSKKCDLYEKGFLACSLVKGQEFNCKIKLRIYVPAGTKCVYQGNVDNEQELYEVDVMHGAKLKIESMDSEYINCRLIETA